MGDQSQIHSRPAEPAAQNAYSPDETTALLTNAADSQRDGRVGVWRASTFGCFQNPGFCLPSVLYGQNSERLLDEPCLFNSCIYFTFRDLAANALLLSLFYWPMPIWSPFGVYTPLFIAMGGVGSMTCGVGALNYCQTREVREIHGIPGNRFEDSMKSCFCTSCVLIQNTLHIDNTERMMERQSIERY